MDAPKYRDYILPLVFLKRLSDVYDDEVMELAQRLGGEERARAMIEADHRLVRIFLPDDCHWSVIRALKTHVGESVTQRSTFPDKSQGPRLVASLFHAHERIHTSFLSRRNSLRDCRRWGFDLCHAERRCFTNSVHAADTAARVSRSMTQRIS
jgi:hypothetical protein